MDLSHDVWCICVALDDMIISKACYWHHYLTWMLYTTWLCLFQKPKILHARRDNRKPWVPGAERHLGWLTHMRTHTAARGREPQPARAARSAQIGGCVALVCHDHIRSVNPLEASPLHVCLVLSRWNSLWLCIVLSGTQDSLAGANNVF